MKTIPLTKGQVALVDDRDFEEVSGLKWYAMRSASGNTFYAKHDFWIGGKRKAMYMHVFITGFRGVDHKDRNGLNNSRKNLRAATNSQNLCNRGIQSNNKSGFKGVSFHTRVGSWRAVITVKQKHIHLGYFSTPKRAGSAYDSAARKYFGSFSLTNRSLALQE